MTAVRSRDTNGHLWGIGVECGGSPAAVPHNSPASVRLIKELSAMTNNNNKPAPVILRGTPLASGPGEGLTLLRILPAWIVSAVIHSVLIGGFLLFLGVIGARSEAGSDGGEQVAVNTNVERESEPLDLTNPDIGIDPTVPLNYDVPRIEQFSVPGEVNSAQP